MAYLSALAGVTFVHEAMALPQIQAFVEGLLYREAMPTLVAIPDHPREDYIRSVLDRFANRGIRDQIARLCIDGSAKFHTTRLTGTVTVPSLAPLTATLPLYRPAG